MNEKNVDGSLRSEAGKPANDGPVKQVIAPNVITRLVDRPEVSVYHQSGRHGQSAAWVMVMPNGDLAFAPGSGPWTAWRDDDGSHERAKWCADQITEMHRNAVPSGDGGAWFPCEQRQA